MLLGGESADEPRVIGDDTDDVGATLNKLSGNLWKD
jgi:hypothetical protein